jgi:Ca2+-binding RTX toxin-like protein
MLPHIPLTNRSVLAPEPLEPRRLLSAAIAHHSLLIEGTPRSDTIVLTRGKRAVTVNVNGQASEFSLRSFSSVRIRAGKGDDMVTVGTNDNAVGAPASVSAGDGNDTVVTGTGDDSVDGGDGDDAISTSSGNDVIHGGAGEDALFGGDGDDQISGDNDADVIFGDAGADSISGGRGNDELHDGLGKDAVSGNGGDDRFYVAEGRKEFRDAAKTEAMTTDDHSNGQLLASRGSTAADRPVVGYSLGGDSNLDGTVDFLDLAKLAQSYNATDGSRNWSTGDINYDGNTDFLDLAKLAQNYNSPLPPAPVTADQSQFEKELAEAFAKAEA